MKIVLTGGGTGGHITPLLAVAHELKQLQPDCHLVYVGERGGKFSDLTSGHSDIDEVRIISAGKFRRYYRESWLRRLLDVRTNFLNVRDVFLVVLGFFQSYRLLGKLKPDVVFLKGGFVGVPIGLAAAMRHIPIVTHDSDALPGLANRLVGRWAAVHAVALPKEMYKYPPARTEQVGVLVEPSFKLVTKDLQQTYKQTLGIPIDAQVLVVTGGSSGAVRINQAMIAIMDSLLQAEPNLYVVHQVGRGKAAIYDNYTHERLKVLEFFSPMHQYLGVADVVVTRGSANTLAELGTQRKACIVIPNPDLTGGHQLKNGLRLQELEAAIVLQEKDMADTEKGLLAAIRHLLANDSERQKLATALAGTIVPNAAGKLAKILVDTVNKHAKVIQA